MAKKRRARKGAYSDAARKFVAREIRSLVERGYSQVRAVAAALRMARKKGYKVPRRNADIGKLLSGARGPRTTQSRRRRTTAKKSSARSRRNPRRGRVIGDAAVALSYEGGEGKRKGKMRGPWEHEFEQDDVQIIGQDDGTILLKSKSGTPLWAEFEV